MPDWPSLSRTAVASLLLGLGLALWVAPGTGSGLVFLTLVASAVAFVAISLLRLVWRKVRRSPGTGDAGPSASFLSRRKDR